MEFERQLGDLTTETRNMATSNIDTLSTEEIVTLICQEDKQSLKLLPKRFPKLWLQPIWCQKNLKREDVCST